MKPSPVEREANRERRAQNRAARSSRIQALKDWREERRIQAQKRERDRRQQDTGPRGVDRVPASLKGLNGTEAPWMVSKRGNRIETERRDGGNYATRRARGERGHARKLRAREMPGAEARRIERNRKAWGA
jgi:hypothetical protein